LLSRPDKAKTLALRPDEAKIGPQGSFGLKAETRREAEAIMLRDRDHNFGLKTKRKCKPY